MRIRIEDGRWKMAPSRHRTFQAMGASAGKDLADDFFDGHFLDVYIIDRQFVQQLLAGGDDLVALDLELDAVGVCCRTSP